MLKTKRCLILLEKCKNMKQLKQSHALVITCGLGSNSFALSRLLAFCSDPEHGNLGYGFKLFEQIEQPTICIYNTMIRAFLLSGELMNAIQIYNRILEKGLFPDNYTLPYVLKACANLQCCPLGDLIHGHCLKFGFVCDIFVGNTLIVMYSAFGNMKAARYMFDEIPLRTVVSWTVMISGYAKQGDVDAARLFFDEAPLKDRGIWGSMISAYVQNNCYKEGLYMFRLMQSSGLEADEAVYVSVICACAQLGALDIGIWIHRHLDHFRLPSSVRLATSLIDMYAKCGHLSLAKKVFDEMPHRDTICWNVMISGMAMHGDGEGALNLFSQMEKAGVRPDDITFIAIFTACSYSGMGTEGLRLLNRMHTVYNLELKSEHYGCLVDLLGRVGLLKEAKGIVEKIPYSTNPSEEAVAWRALLSACCNYEQSQLAEVAAERLLQLERHSGVYVLLSNLYAAAGKHDDARRIRMTMRNRRVEKIPASSSVEINGIVHEFIAGEKTHPQIDEINKLLEQLNKNLEIPGSNHIC